MNLSKKEKELLRKIAEAQSLGQPIIFHEDEREISDFRREYGEAYRSLSDDRLYIDGAIDKHSFLMLTGYGEKALAHIEKSEEKVEKKKSCRREWMFRLVIGITGAIAGSLITWLLGKL
jgi:hypothetical protein